MKSDTYAKASGNSPNGVQPLTTGLENPPLEFRPDEDGKFDEIVARFADGVVHVETMSNKSCYVGFYWDDGRYCQWWISADKKLRYHHEDGMNKPPRFTAQGVDRKPWLEPGCIELSASGIEARRGETACGLDAEGTKARPDAQTPQEEP